MDKLFAELRRLGPAQQGRILRRAVGRGGAVYVRSLKRLSPSRTVAKAVRQSTRGNLTHVTVNVGVRSKRAKLLLRWMESGTKPHEVRVKKGGGKRIMSRGGTPYGRHFMHPGARPHPFFERAVSAGTPDVEAAIREEFRRQLAKISGFTLLKHRG